MPKTTILLVALLVAISSVFNSVSAQSEKTSVGILPFTYADGAANSQSVNSVQETVTNAFVKTRRFNIVDRSKMDALRQEKDLQKSEDFIDGAVVQQGVALGANFLISGHLISAQAEEMIAEDDKGNKTRTYKAKLSISLKVMDVATGQVITSETIEPKAGNSLLGAIGIGHSTPQAAMAQAIKDVESEVDKFVGRNFPVTFSIVEVQEKDKKGNATKILVAGGSAFGLKKGDKLKVVELMEMEVNGKKVQRKKEIGELKISNVEDENFSACSVSSGGIDINSKFESKANLQVITKD